MAAIDDERRRADARTVRTLLERVTGEPAVRWVPRLVIGFSPRKVTPSVEHSRTSQA